MIVSITIRLSFTITNVSLVHKNVLYITSNNEFLDKFLNLYKKYIKALSIMNIFTNKNKNCMPINNEKITYYFHVM